MLNTEFKKEKHTHSVCGWDGCWALELAQTANTVQAKWPDKMSISYLFFIFIRCSLRNEIITELVEVANFIAECVYVCARVLYLSSFLLATE